MVWLGDYLRIDEGFLGHAVKEVPRVWRGRVPFNDSLSAECTVGPYYMQVHCYMHGYAGGKISLLVPPKQPGSLE